MWYRPLTKYGALVWEQNGILGVLLLNLFGADVAFDAVFAHMAILSLTQAELVHVGREAVLSSCSIECYSKSDGYKPVHIGNHAQVGLYARLNPGCVVEADGVVGHQTILDEVVRVQSGTTVFGSPPHAVLQNPPKQFKVRDLGIPGRLRQFVQPLVTRGIVLALLAFVALIPSYEIAVLAFYGDASFYRDSDYLLGVTESGKA